jgi:hypothetical protein
MKVGRCKNRREKKRGIRRRKQEKRRSGRSLS